MDSPMTAIAVGERDALTELAGLLAACGVATRVERLAPRVLRWPKPEARLPGALAAELGRALGEALVQRYRQEHG